MWDHRRGCSQSDWQLIKTLWLNLNYCFYNVLYLQMESHSPNVTRCCQGWTHHHCLLYLPAIGVQSKTTGCFGEELRMYPPLFITWSMQLCSLPIFSHLEQEMISIKQHSFPTCYIRRFSVLSTVTQVHTHPAFSGRWIKGSRLYVLFLGWRYV